MPSFVFFQYFICFILAAIPAVIWGYLFLRKEPEQKSLVAFTFIGGMFSVIPLFIFKEQILKINDFIASFGFSLIFVAVLSYLWVGCYEEVAKFWVVRIVDNDRFRNIDDSIEFSIISALGFAFIENILYFFAIWNGHGLDGLVIPFILRSAGSTFAHVFFSGIFGYYYGIAHFASPILQEQLKAKKKLFFTKFVHRILHLKTETIFHEEKMAEGLLIAVSLHAIFNVFLELSWTFLIIPFLFVGYFLLNYLLDKKEDHKIYGLVGEERTSLMKL